MKITKSKHKEKQCLTVGSVNKIQFYICITLNYCTNSSKFQNISAGTVKLSACSKHKERQS